MLLPIPKRYLSAAASCGALFYFFQNFQIEGLESLSIAPSHNSAVATGQPNYPVASNSNSSSWWSPSNSTVPFPSTSQPLEFQSPSSFGLVAPNARDFNPPRPSNQLGQGSDDRWAALPTMHSATHADSSFVGESIRSGASPVQSAQSNLSNYERKIRIGSFNLDHLDHQRLSDPIVLDRLGQILNEFSCIAVQGLAANDPAMLSQLISQMQIDGKRFEHLLGPAVQIGQRTECLAIFFDTSKIEIDRFQSYTLNDPAEVLEIEPLVTWFRCKEVDRSQAFTFTLVNMQMHQTLSGTEIDYLSEILESIRGDGRNEDDVIVAGFFEDSSAVIQKKIGSSAKCLTADNPSNEFRQIGQNQILVSNFALREFLGNHGEFNTLRRYNLTPDQAAAISRYSAAWAEFSTLESTAW